MDTQDNRVVRVLRKLPVQELASRFRGNDEDMLANTYPSKAASKPLSWVAFTACA